MTKRILALVMALAMVLSMVPAFAYTITGATCKCGTQLSQILNEEAGTVTYTCPNEECDAADCVHDLRDYSCQGEKCATCGATISGTEHKNAWRQSNSDAATHVEYCEDCGVELSRSEHNADKAADTCVAQAVCSVCNLSWGEKSTTNHVGEKEWVVTADGTHTQRCSKCYAGYTSHSANVASNYVLAEDGKYYCSICGLEGTPACAGHNFQPVVGYDAKCNEDNTFTPGLTNGSQCTKCGAWEIVQEPIVITEHLAVTETPVSPATCTKDGLKYVVCAYCGYEDYETIDKTEAHTYVNKGNVKGCADCWDATCTIEGKDHYVCSECGAVKHETVKALGHTYNKQALVNIEGDHAYDPEKTVCDLDVYSIIVCGRVVNEDGDICGARKDAAPVQVATSDEDGDEWKLSKTVDPTCTEQGYKLYVCKNTGCTNTHKDSYTDPIGYYNKETGKYEHNEGVVSVDIKPTCTEDGSYIVICPTCSEELEGTVKKIPATGHINDEVEMTACRGSHKNCYYVNGSFTWQYASKAPEDGVLVWEYVKPTCKTNGYWVSNCPDCGENYKVKDFSENCVSCQSNGTAHKEVAGKVIVEATCETDGYAQTICEVCGTIIKHEDGTDKRTTIEGGHVWVFDGEPYVEANCGQHGEGWMICTRCGEREYFEDVVAENYGKHTWVKNVHVDATCELPAQTVTMCTVCGATKDADEVDGEENKALGHDMQVVAWIDLCNYAYGQKLECSRCDKVEYKGIGLIGDAATNELTVYHGTQADVGKEYIIETTCTTDGLYNTRACRDCDWVSVNFNEVKVEPAAHDYEEDTDASTVANCVDYACKVEVCSVCGDVKKTYGDELATVNNVSGTGHKSWEVVEWIGAPATCTTSGKGYYGCSACGAKAEDASYVQWHHYFNDDVYVVIKAPTCSAKGEGVRTCVDCGVYETNADNTPKHIELAEVGKCAFGKVTVESGDCTKIGFVKYECLVCGAGYVAEDEDDDTVTYLNDATNDVTNGVYGTGDNAVKNIIAVIPAGKHKWGESTLREATCEQPAGLRHTCVYCGYEVAVKPDGVALGHDFTDEVTVPATCYVEGSVSKFCARCGKTVKTEIPALEHELEEDTDLALAATCGTTGYKVLVCKHEGCKYTEKVVTALNANNHVYVTTTSLKEADCKTGASGLAIQKCKYCAVSNKLNVIPAEHDWVVTDVKLAATCTDTGIAIETCSVCGKTQETEIEMLEHTLVTESFEATCDEVAHTATYCSVCSYMYKKVKTGSKELGHVWGDKVYVAATCEDDAHFETTCTRCGEVVDSSIPAESDYAEEAYEHEGAKLVEKFAGTCVEKSYEVYHCDLCGKDIKVEGAYNYDKQTGHDYVITYTYGKTVDCGNPGYVDLKCNLCNQTLKMQKWAPEHTMSNYVVENDIVYKVCLVCGKMEILWASDSFENYEGCTTITTKVEDGKVIKVVEGTHKGLVVVEGKDATCTEAGQEARIECTVCGVVILDGSVIPAHTTKEVAEVPATCTEAGTTAGVYCTVCDEYISGHEVIEALGHDIVVVPGKDATASETGLTAGKKCSRCDYWEEEQEVLAKKNASLKRVAVLRETAELLGNRIDVLAQTTAITVTGEMVNGFYPVSTAAGNGYIHNSYITVE